MKIIVAFMAFTVIALAGWQVGACIVANVELRDDMQDIASEIGGRIGLNQPSTDDDFRKDVLRHAQQHGIDLTPDQVTIRRTGTHPDEEIYLAADYIREIRLLGLTYALHFSPEAHKQFHESDWRR